MSINISIYNVLTAAIYSSMPNQLEAANYAEYYQTAYRTYEDAVSTQQEMDRLAGQDRYEDARNKYKGAIAGYNFARSLFKKMISFNFSGYKSNEYYGKAEGMVAKIDAILAALKEPVRPVIVQQPRVEIAPPPQRSEPVRRPEIRPVEKPWGVTITEAEASLNTLRGNFWKYETYLHYYWVERESSPVRSSREALELKAYYEQANKIAQELQGKYSGTKYELWGKVYSNALIRCESSLVARGAVSSILMGIADGQKVRKDAESSAALQQIRNEASLLYRMIVRVGGGGIEQIAPNPIRSDVAGNLTTPFKKSVKELEEQIFILNEYIFINGKDIYEFRKGEEIALRMEKECPGTIYELWADIYLARISGELNGKHEESLAALQMLKKKVEQVYVGTDKNIKHELNEMLELINIFSFQEKQGFEAQEALREIARQRELKAGEVPRLFSQLKYHFNRKEYCLAEPMADQLISGYPTTKYALWAQLYKGVIEVMNGKYERGIGRLRCVRQESDKRLNIETNADLIEEYGYIYGNANRAIRTAISRDRVYSNTEYGQYLKLCDVADSYYIRAIEEDLSGKSESAFLDYQKALNLFRQMIIPEYNEMLTKYYEFEGFESFYTAQCCIEDIEAILAGAKVPRGKVL